MTKQEYESKRDDLFRRWNEVHPEYEEEINGVCVSEFSYDGIVNFEVWQYQKLKVLFLVKETHGSDKGGCWHPSVRFERVGIFGNNIARWNYLLKELFNKREGIIEFPANDVLPKELDDVAVVEIKKKSGKSSSNNNQIIAYAERDKDFLREEIDLISPHIVFCGYTGEAYGDYIYGDEEWDKLKEVDGRTCHKHRERLVIDFFHPSYAQVTDGSEYLWNTLYALLDNGKIFDNFEWGKKIDGSN